MEGVDHLGAHSDGEHSSQSLSDWRHHQSLMSAIESELQFDESTAQHETEPYRSQIEMISDSAELNSSLQSLDTQSESGQDINEALIKLGHTGSTVEIPHSAGFIPDRKDVFSSSPVLDKAGEDESDEDSNPYSAYRRFYEDQTHNKQSLNSNGLLVDVPHADITDLVPFNDSDEQRTNLMEFEALEKEVAAVLKNLPGASSFLTNQSDEELPRASLKTGNSNHQSTLFNNEMLTLMAAGRYRNKDSIERTGSFDDDSLADISRESGSLNNSKRGLSPSRIPKLSSRPSTPRSRLNSTGGRGDYSYRSQTPSRIPLNKTRSQSSDQLSKVSSDNVPVRSGRRSISVDSISKLGRNRRSRIPSPASRGRESPSLERYNSEKSISKIPRTSRPTTPRSASERREEDSTRIPTRSQTADVTSRTKTESTSALKLKHPVQPSNVPNSKPSVASVSEITTHLPNSSNEHADDYTSANESEALSDEVYQPINNELTLSDLKPPNNSLAQTHKSSVREKRGSATSDNNDRSQSEGRSSRRAARRANKENIRRSSPSTNQTPPKNDQSEMRVEIKSLIPFNDARRDSPSQFGEAKALKDAILALEGAGKAESTGENNSKISPEKTSSWTVSEPEGAEPNESRALSSTWTSLNEFNQKSNRHSSTPTNDSTIHKSLTMSDFTGMEEPRTRTRSRRDSKRKTKETSTSPKKLPAVPKESYAKPTKAYMSRYQAHRASDKEESSYSESDVKSGKRKSQSIASAPKTDQSPDTDGKAAEELCKQLQIEYSELLSKYAMAENTIDQMRLGAKINLYYDKTPQSQAVISQPNTARSASTIHVGHRSNRAQVGIMSLDTTPRFAGSPRLNESQISYTVDPTQAALDLRIGQLLDQMDAFDILEDQGSLTPLEQKQLYTKLRQAHELIQQQYREAKELNPSIFDPDSLLAGQLYQADRRLDDYHELMNKIEEQRSYTLTPSPHPQLGPQMSPYDEDGAPRNTPSQAPVEVGEPGSEKRLERSPRGHEVDGSRRRKTKHQSNISDEDLSSTEGQITSISEDDTIKHHNDKKRAGGSIRSRKSSQGTIDSKNKISPHRTLAAVPSMSSVADSGISTPKTGQQKLVSGRTALSSRFPQESTDSGFIGSEEGKRSPYHPSNDRNTELDPIPQNDYSESSNPSALSPDLSETRTAQWAARHKEIIDMQAFSPPHRNQRDTMSRSSRRSSQQSSVKSAKLRELSAQLSSLKNDWVEGEVESRNGDPHMNTETPSFEQQPRKLSPIRASHNMSLPDKYLRKVNPDPARTDRDRRTRTSYSDLDLSEVEPSRGVTPQRRDDRRNNEQNSIPQTKPESRSNPPPSRSQQNQKITHGDPKIRSHDPNSKGRDPEFRGRDRGSRGPESEVRDYLDSRRRAPVTSSVISDDFSRSKSTPDTVRMSESVRKGLIPPELIDSYTDMQTPTPSKLPPAHSPQPSPYQHKTRATSPQHERQHSRHGQRNASPAYDRPRSTNGREEIHRRRDERSFDERTDLDPEHRSRQEQRPGETYTRPDPQSRRYTSHDEQPSKYTYDPTMPELSARDLDETRMNPDRSEYYQHSRSQSYPADSIHQDRSELVYDSRREQHQRGYPESSYRPDSRIVGSQRGGRAPPIYSEQPNYRTQTLHEPTRRTNPGYQQPNTQPSYHQPTNYPTPYPTNQNTAPYQPTNYNHPHQQAPSTPQQPNFQSPAAVYANQPIATHISQQAPPAMFQPVQYHPSATVTVPQPVVTSTPAVIHKVHPVVNQAPPAVHVAGNVTVQKCSTCSGSGLLAHTTHCTACGSQLAISNNQQPAVISTTNQHSAVIHASQPAAVIHTANQPTVFGYSANEAVPILVGSTNDVPGSAYLTQKSADGSFVTEKVDVISDTASPTRVVHLPASTERTASNTRYYMRDDSSSGDDNSRRRRRQSKSMKHALDSLDDLELSLRSARRSAASLKQMSRSMRGELEHEMNRSFHRLSTSALL